MLFIYSLFPLFFSFPNPPRRVEKNGASKGDGTEIRVKNGYTKGPDFGSRRGGLGETKSGGVNSHYLRPKHGTAQSVREFDGC
jgi:hypothetical protein